MKIDDCKTPEQIEEILLDKDYIVNDDVFSKLPIGTLKILKLFILKGYTLNDNSYEIIMSDIFCDEEYYEVVIYLHKHKYNISDKMLKDFEKCRKE